MGFSPFICYGVLTGYYDTGYYDTGYFNP
jgi:hypothetical protein